MGDRMGLQQPLSRAGAWGRGDPPGDTGGEGSPCQARGRLHGCPCWGSVLGSLLAAGPVAEDAVCRASGSAVGDVCAVGGSVWCRHPSAWRCERHEHVASVSVLGGHCGGHTCGVGAGAGEGQLRQWDAAAVPWAREGSAVCSPFTCVSAPGSLPAPAFPLISPQALRL